MGNLLRASATLFMVVAAAACSPNAQHTKATVSYIDRNCKIVRTTYDGDYKRTGSETLRSQYAGCVNSSSATRPSSAAKMPTAKMKMK